MQPHVLSAGTLTGDKVRNFDGENLGDIQELMVDFESGRIVYAVLDFGGFLGIGNKLFAVPWQALSLDIEKREFMLNVDKEKLKGAPGFDKDQWPDLTDMQMAKAIYNYYGYTPFWHIP